MHNLQCIVLWSVVVALLNVFYICVFKLTSNLHQHKWQYVHSFKSLEISTRISEILTKPDNAFGQFEIWLISQKNGTNHAPSTEQVHISSRLSDGSLQYTKTLVM